MPFERLRNWFRKQRGADSESPGSGAADLARLGDLWDAVQQIAREENPAVFTDKTVVQHAAETVEGKKDVERWLNVYLKRANPSHPYRFPEHHPRHRGYCLMPRHWPSGTVWEAFDDETLLRARVESRRTREEIVAALDEWLEGEGRGAPETPA